MSDLQVDLQVDLTDRLKVSKEAIAAFCQRWQIVEFALFGSVLRDDFRDDSDIDVLVTYADSSSRTLSDILTIQEEIEILFDRKVDLIQKRLLKNPYSRAEILRTHRIIYASQ